MAKKEENEQKDAQNKAQDAMKEGLKSALSQGNKSVEKSAAPTPKPGMDGQKSDNSAAPTPKPKPGGADDKNDMMKNLLKAGLDLLQGKDPSKHLNKALGGIMKGMTGAENAGGKANMGKDAKAAKGPEPDAAKGAGLDSNNPAGGMLKSIKEGPKPGAGGGGPDLKDIVKKGM